MPTYIQPGTIADVLMLEVAQGWTKEVGVMAAGVAYARGDVLAKVTGKYHIVDPAGSGDAAIAVGVLGDPVDATAADAKGVIIARGAVVDAAALVYPAGATAPQIALAVAQLESRGIVARAVL